MNSVAAKDFFESLFNWKVKAKHISKLNYPRVFDIIRSIPDYRFDRKLAETLERTIEFREKTLKHHQSLPVYDQCHSKTGDSGHQDMIKVLKDCQAKVLKQLA